MPNALSDETRILSQPMGGDSTAAFSAVGYDPRTQAMTLAPCPICQTPGAPGETYCLECGFLTGSKPGDLSDGPARSLPKLVDAEGREFALRAGENIVGRDGADIMLRDQTVSRRHARIVVEEGSVWAEDLGSTNGTRVRSASLPSGQQTSLTDRTSVQFGSVKLTVLIPENSIRELLALPASPATETRSDEQPAAAAIAGSGLASASAARVVRANGTEYTLISSRTTFGRKTSNDVVIDDDSYVSGNHAEIVYEAGGFFLEDVGSTNGTKLNGRSLLPRIPEPVHDGDAVTMGRTEFRFHGPT